EDAVHVESPRLAVIARLHRRVRGPAVVAVPPEVDRDAPRRPLEQFVRVAVLCAVERTDEDDVVPDGALEVLEHARVEADAEVLRPNAQRAEALHVVRERREDEVVGPQPAREWSLARDLPYDERTEPAEPAEEPSGEEPNVLHIDDVGRILGRLGE